MIFAYINFKISNLQNIISCAIIYYINKNPNSIQLKGENSMTKKRLFALLAIFMIAALSLTACKADPWKNIGTEDIYFTNPSKNGFP